MAGYFTGLLSNALLVVSALYSLRIVIVWRYDGGNREMSEGIKNIW